MGFHNVRIISAANSVRPQKIVVTTVIEHVASFAWSCAFILEFDVGGPGCNLFSIGIESSLVDASPERSKVQVVAAADCDQVSIDGIICAPSLGSDACGAQVGPGSWHHSGRRSESDLADLRTEGRDGVIHVIKIPNFVHIGCLGVKHISIGISTSEQKTYPEISITGLVDDGATRQSNTLNGPWSS